MKRIYVPTSSPDDWRKLLVEPAKQWRSGYSAMELAERWEQADGFPSEFQTLFASSDNPALHNPELLLAIPEHQVNLPGGSRPSQNDLFVLARTGDSTLAAIMVEGKASEPFGETMETWLLGASRGKQVRLKYLCKVLGLAAEPPMHIRYQLLHRTVSAIIEAKRFSAAYAMMVVHSFSSEHRWLSDYQEFLGLFGVSGHANEIVQIPIPSNVRMYLGWVVGKPRT